MALSLGNLSKLFTLTHLIRIPGVTHETVLTSLLQKQMHTGYLQSCQVALFLVATETRILLYQTAPSINYKGCHQYHSIKPLNIIRTVLLQYTCFLDTFLGWPTGPSLPFLILLGNVSQMNLSPAHISCKLGYTVHEKPTQQCIQVHKR